MATTAAGSTSQRTNWALLLLAVLLALVAAVLVFAALSKGGGEEETAAPVTTSVVVVSHDIPARTKLTEEMLEVQQVPPDAALRNGFTATTPLIGQVTRYPLVEGEQMTALKVGPQGQEEDDGLSFVIPAGRRALAVSVTEVTGVGGLLLPGDMVDVIVVLDEGDVGTDKAVTLLQNIEVLAVAQEAQEPLPPAQAAADGETASQETRALGERPEDIEPQPNARTVTLAVTPEETQLLALAQEKGKLVLALRPFGEEDTLSLDDQTLLPLRTP